MDIKDLNKPQLILLALLLSFVTSIATGITTVTLMQQAPPSVITPINRIVRQTVEKIVPAESKNTVQTVVVKEEDLVVDSIAKNKGAIFSVSKETTGQDGNVAEVSAGEAFAVSESGILVADGTLIPEAGVYYVKNDSGKFKADFISTYQEGFALLRVGAPLDDKSKISYTVPASGSLDEMKAGQKILVLGSDISSFIYDGNKQMKINVTKSTAGGLVLNLDGNALGVALSGDTTSFASMSSIEDALKTVPSIAQ